MTQTAEPAATTTTAADSPLSSRERGAGGVRSFPRYPAYRDSGVSWLGAIPAHWVIAPIYARYSVQLGKMLSPETVRGINPAPYLRNANVQWDNIDLTDVLEMDFSPEERRKYELAPGDLLVCEGGEVGRCAIWHGELEPCFIQNAIHRVRPLSSGDDTRFLFYGMYTAASYGVLQAEGNRSTIVHLTAEKLKVRRIAFPPLPEQRAIAAFLDRETARIDALVAAKRRLIELLREKRAALISRAVTRGLDASVPLRESGVPWLGAVSAHWQMVSLRRVIQRFVDYRGATPEKVPAGVPLITARNIKSGAIDFVTSQEYMREEDYADWMVRGFPRRGDVVVTTEAPLGEAAQIEDENIALAQRIILLKAYSYRLDNDWLKFYLMSASGQGELWSRATGSTAIGIKASHLREVLVTLPPLSEQRAIAAYLDAETAKLDALAGRIEEQIARLREYRTALIAAAVTGAIDVRGQAVAGDGSDGEKEIAG